jgi:hypothetical protein
MMDEIEMMVAETFRHLRENYQDAGGTPEEIQPESAPLRPGLPTDPGVLYHIQKSASVFVIRTFVSRNIREDYLRILETPENYPSLRLIDGEDSDVESRLKFFLVENEYQAEVIHDQLNNRRFPMNEETMCNLSDPGFSWWLTRKDNTLQVAFNLSSFLDEGTIKLGPLGDRELALQSFLQFGELLNKSGIKLAVQNEPNRVVFEEDENLLVDEFQDLFEMGVMGTGMTELFKLLARKSESDGSLESLWYYFQELAGIRRFWIQIQYDIGASA